MFSTVLESDKWNTWESPATLAAFRRDDLYWEEISVEVKETAPMEVEVKPQYQAEGSFSLPTGLTKPFVEVPLATEGA